MIYVLKDASDKIVNQRHQQIIALFNNSDEAYESIKAEGIDYIIQTKWLTPQFKPNDDLTLAYSTDSLNIYRLKKTIE